ncbi:pyridoxamine 5'-phosphate oxidase family protein [Jiangella alba]|uniref:Pyridoxamine 5'-phosphate oxidase n=1 Tax=Jiangella alba TaxID=561176 RepID=A0A1H5PVL0_9ACTN|nr:pyridoxamine 5'-phosphate oxidase family protein [Jiangella alba]SEF17241.1 Pyridoxamine 5'-phosphate oxidase [Jiangella alba]
MSPTAELLFRPEDATPMSTDEADLLPWPVAAELLAAVPKYWLATGRADGRPHVMPVLGVWLGGTLAVSSRPGSVKARNLRRDGDCVVTAATDGGDLVVEGTAVHVTGAARQRELAAAFAAKYDWRFGLRDGRVYDDSLPGSPEYAFFEITPAKGFGYGADGLTATRWRF